jgi:release factor family 10
VNHMFEKGAVVVERALEATDLDEQALLDLVRTSDPIGVVSVYIDTQTATAGPRSRGWPIEVKNRLAELERRLTDDDAPSGSDAIVGAVARIAPLLERQADPGLSGRGRALFAWLGRAEVTSFSSQMRLANRVVLDASPFIHPLLELVEAGRPAGVALIATDGVELLDWRLGELRRLTRIAPDGTDSGGQRPGPVVTNAARAQQITPWREQRARREREQRRRLLDRAAREASRLGDERAWAQILVSGDERLTTHFVDALPGRLRDRAIRQPRHPSAAATTKLADAVCDRFARERAQRNLELTRRVRDAAFGAGGALGLSEVIAALNEARVAHLVYDPEIRYEGTMDADGWLYVASELGGVGVIAEPRLTERMVERCLETAARVTPVGGAATGALADAGGIAAVLRW